MKNKYSIQIFWSAEDAGFIAICRDFPGLSAFGESREEALAEAEIALNLIIESYVANGMSLPEPVDELVAA